MATHLKHLASKILQRTGYTIVPTWRLDKLPMATYLAELLRSLDIGCVLDVGANVGQYRDFLRLHVGYGGQIISFEPNQRNARILEERASRDTNWDVVPLALGDENVETSLNIMERDELSSFLTPDNSHVPEFETMNVIKERQVTKIRRLDDWAAHDGRVHDLSKVYLKVDTQGFDLRVFNGATQLRPKILAMQTEVSCLPIYRGGVRLPDAVRPFIDAGFDIGEMFAVGHDRRLRAIEFDCIMINARAGTN